MSTDPADDMAMDLLKAHGDAFTRAQAAEAAGLPSAEIHRHNADWAFAEFLDVTEEQHRRKG
ncbi:hypothetical protein AB0I84_30555 [Streptomyces spectabilis]|uniref:hypothetical protein n=1 Tax=Streptomyces spectabilis TaxID=68270 RepID=UPI0034060BF2